jgi:ubiquinone/menaquinone biosynthesis C-methylase UbiE
MNSVQLETNKDDKQQFISGEWYDREYDSGWYRMQYENQPEWAEETNLYYVDLITAMLGLKNKANILDMGSGAGHFIRTWESRGHNVQGMELSKKAIELSGLNCITQGSVHKMPFKEQVFDLVFSASLLEHIDESMINDVIKEAYRVGEMQAHLIGLEKGTDPSHINIKTIEEWQALFMKHNNGKNAVIKIEDVLLRTFPILLVVPQFLLTRPMREAVGL